MVAFNGDFVILEITFSRVGGGCWGPASGALGRDEGKCWEAGGFYGQVTYSSVPRFPLCKMGGTVLT